MAVFRNSYYLMRHGQSEANVAGLVVSAPLTGIPGYGLTATGREQVRTSLAQFSGVPPTRVISSDFLRARQTAELVAGYFSLPEPVLEAGLRERFFGVWEGQTDSCYEAVWMQDDAGSEGAARIVEYEVEPVSAVRQRGLDMLCLLEQRYSDEVLLLVSHGDVLQILQTAFAGLAATEHRQIAHHRTAEIRWLASRGRQDRRR